MEKKELMMDIEKKGLGSMRRYLGLPKRIRTQVWRKDEKKKGR